jgi:folate-binding protein YgfZ
MPDLENAAYRAARDAAVVCPVPELAQVDVDGEDAPAFLQGQLSNDALSLEPGHAQWSTYNSPKGRTLASLRLARRSAASSPPSFGALLATDLAAATAKRLAMHVLRARVRVAVAAADTVVGVGGPGAADAIAAAFGTRVAAGAAAALFDDAAFAIGLGDGRYALVAAPAAAERVHAALATHALPAANDVWRWLGIRAGIPLVTAATADRFVAQMLNFDALGAIRQAKGCYAGQEIIKRTSALGILKERLYGFRADAPPPAAGVRVFSPVFGEQPCGVVVDAAPDPEGGSSLLVVVQIAAADAGAVALGAPDGPPLARFALPYAVPATAPRERVRL